VLVDDDSEIVDKNYDEQYLKFKRFEGDRDEYFVKIPNMLHYDISLDMVQLGITF